jgi:hypothetical protein
VGFGLIAIVFSLVLGFLAIAGERVHLGGSGSFGAIAFPVVTLAWAAAQLLHGEPRRVDAAGPHSAVAAFSQACGRRAVPGVVLFSIGAPVTLFTGWWPVIAISGSAMVGSTLWAAPTRKRIAHVEAGLRVSGFDGELLDQLLAAPPLVLAPERT